MLDMADAWARGPERSHRGRTVNARWLAGVLFVASIGCGTRGEDVVWSEPLAPTAEGGVLVLTKVAQLRGDVVEQRCSATRLIEVGATLAARVVESGTPRLCEVTRTGTARTALDERGHFVYSDMSDGGRLKISIPHEERTVTLMDGCPERDPVLASDWRNRRIATYLTGCGRSNGSWVHILQFAPGLRAVTGKDSVHVEPSLRGLSFGPLSNGLLAHVRDGGVDRIIVLDLMTRGTSDVTRGRLPAAQSTGKAFVFVRDEPGTANDWVLMFSDSVGAAARKLISRTVARERIGDSSAVQLAPPILSLDNRSVWLGFGGRILRVQLTTGHVDVVVP